MIFIIAVTTHHPFSVFFLLFLLPLSLFVSCLPACLFSYSSVSISALSFPLKGHVLEHVSKKGSLRATGPCCPCRTCKSTSESSDDPFFPIYWLKICHTKTVEQKISCMRMSRNQRSFIPERAQRCVRPRSVKPASFMSPQATIVASTASIREYSEKGTSVAGC